MTNRLDNLTDREREVLGRLAEGLSNAQIASLLHLAPQTVRWYNSQIYSKLGVKNRHAAVTRAAELGLLSDGRTAQALRSNLPAETTPFIGRSKELRELTELLADRQLRLITILGLGGMGKTRLVLKLAEQLVHNHAAGFADGVFFIPLLPLSDAQQIVTQIGAQIGYKFTGDRVEPKQQLLDHLSDKQLLLVMDNWEHLLGGAALIDEMLSAAPGLRLLATSRERLNLMAETVFSIGGMALPTWEAPDDAAQSDAVQLLVQTARRTTPDWQVDASNVQYVRQIASLTEGMPLAIVLAASWLDTLSLADIAEDLTQDIDLLASEMRAVPARQHSIRAVFDYAWQQLQPDERGAFMKLSVFRGGFTRRAAQAVTGANSRILQALVNKALLTRSRSGRYEVHELLRQYAGQELQQSQENEAARKGYYRYFLNWLAGLEADIKGVRQVEALDEVEDDFDNIRSAWSYALQNNEIALLVQASESFYLYCEMRALFAEGQDLFARAQEHVAGTAEQLPAWSRFVLCKERLYEAPRPSGERSRAIQIAQTAGDLNNVALGLLIAGRSKWIYQGEFEDALQYFEEAHDIYRRLGDRFYIAYAVNRIGLCHTSLGNSRKGIDLTLESAAAQREIGDQAGLGISLNNLGAFNFLEGEYEVSTRMLRESISVGEQSHNGGNLVFGCGMLSIVYFSGAEFGMARGLAERAGKLGQEIGYLQGASLGVASLGLLSTVVDNDYDPGLRLSQESLRLAQESNVGLQTFSRCGIVLATCGLGSFERLRRELGQLVHQSWLSVTIWGFIAAASAAYCRHTESYDLAIRLLSFAMNNKLQTFRWAKQWHLLKELEFDLRARADEETFGRCWRDGRQYSLDQAKEAITGSLARPLVSD